MKPKNTSKGYWLTEELERIEQRRGEYIRSRYYVIEITPSKRYDRGNGHGGSEYAWSREKRNKVSEYFTSKPQAQDFLDMHEPDEGKTLAIVEEKLYRKMVEKWY